MAEILRYVLVSRQDVEQNEEYESYQDAVATARRLSQAVIRRTYEYCDSELVWTPDGSDVWPPNKEGKDERT